MIDSETGCPKDYAELFQHYFPMMRSIVARAGIASDDVEDVAMDILTKLMKRDALSWYDPNKLHDVGPNPKLPGPRLRPAKFQGLLRALTGLYVRQYLDKQAAYEKRNPAFARLDGPPQAAASQQESWYDSQAQRLGLVTEQVAFQRIEIRMLLNQARANAALEVKAAVSGQTILARQKQQALEAAIELAEAGERVTGAAVSRKMGWSSACALVALNGARADLRAVGL